MKRFLILALMFFVCLNAFTAAEVDMNTPVVDPNIWYQMQVNDGVRGMWLSLVVISLIALVVIALAFAYSATDNHYTWKEDKGKIIIWCCGLGLCLCLVFIGSSIYIYTPSSETMLKMAVTSQITPDNIDGVKQDIKGVVDYIIEKVKELK